MELMPRVRVTLTPRLIESISYGTVPLVQAVRRATGLGLAAAKNVVDTVVFGECASFDVDCASEDAALRFLDEVRIIAEQDPSLSLTAELLV